MIDRFTPLLGDERGVRHDDRTVRRGDETAGWCLRPGAVELSRWLAARIARKHMFLILDDDPSRELWVATTGSSSAVLSEYVLANVETLWLLAHWPDELRHSSESDRVVGWLTHTAWGKAFGS